MDDDPTALGEALTEDQLHDAGPVVEATARLVIPKKGKLFEEDGSVGICVIRPCVSRGRRLRGLPPIYAPKMLAENASVFDGWHMFMDHLSEAMVEAVRKRQRSIRELGGRVLPGTSHFSPDFRRPDDDDHGYKPGAVLARAIPQPPIRAMLEADPEILHTSINAWPTSAREGTLWGQKGMLVEGIRRAPQGSVDWVLRGGAGGHVLAEDEALAVSLLEAYYDAPRTTETDVTDFANMTLEQLTEALREKAPKLHTELVGRLSEAATHACPVDGKKFGSAADLAEHMASAHPKVKEDAPSGGVSFSLDDVKGLLTETATGLERSFEQKLAERDSLVEDRAGELLEEREGWRRLEEEAHKLIKRAGLPKGWTNELLARYSVLPSGPTSALQVSEGEREEDGKTVTVTVLEALRESIDRDVRHAVSLIRESGGTATVRGLGGVDTTTSNSTARVAEDRPAWRDDLHVTVKEGEKEDDKFLEALREGIS